MSARKAFGEEEWNAMMEQLATDDPELFAIHRTWRDHFEEALVRDVSDEELEAIHQSYLGKLANVMQARKGNGPWSRYTYTTS